jgi:hypothetical protein
MINAEGFDRPGSIAAPTIVVVPGARMLLVEVAVQVPQGTMIRTVFGSAVEAFLVRTPVSLIHLPVKSPVRPMVSVVSTVTVLVSQSCGCWCRKGQRSRCEDDFADGHGSLSYARSPPQSGSICAPEFLVRET